MVAELIYTLCALTSLLCALLLLRSYKRSRVRLLLWSGLCFVGLAANNALLIVERMAGETSPMLATTKGLLAAGGMVVLLFGLIWEST